MAEKLNIYLHKLNKLKYMDDYYAEDNIDMVERTYGVKLVGELRNIVGSMENVSEIELDDGEEIRLLEISEVIEPKDYFEVDFSSEGLIPLFDLYDNDILVYDIYSQLYCKYNLDSMSVFKTSTDFSALL